MPSVQKETAPDKHAFGVDQEPERDGLDYGPDDDYMEVVSSIPPDLQGENVDIGDTMGENYSSEGPVKDTDMDVDPNKNYSQDIVQRTKEPETKVDEPEPPDEPEPDKPKEKSATQKRIDQLVKERNEAREALAFERGRAAQEPEPGEPELEKPKLEDFESYEEYTEALTDFKLELRDRKRAAEAADADRVKTRDIVKAKLDEGYEKYDDFEEIAFADNVPINDAMIEVLAECDNAADIAYHLGKNTADALKISRLSTVGMARELGRLDSQFSNNSEPAAKTTPKKVTKAPPPINPVNTGSSDVTPKDPEDMTMAEYINYRTKGGKRRV